MGVKLQSSSGGSVDITAPVTASNYVLTAPAVTSTVDTLARTGNVLQVVSATYSTQFSTTSTTAVDTGLTASITPSSTSSKILVLINAPGFMAGGSLSSAWVNMYLLRNSTTIYSTQTQDTGTTTQGFFSADMLYLDSPNTTSTVVYKNRVKTYDGTPTLFLFWGTSATITLMEIAG